jgi:small nuclear ribonucleoprotein (snRNP)-like protein
VAETDPIDGLLDELRRWAADDETARLARSRSRARWLHQQAAESATLAGVLLDLAEHRVVVTVETGARAHTGSLVAVSTGVCVLQEIDDAEHHLALVPLATITMLVPPVQAHGDRVPNLQLDLAGVLAGLAADRPTVSLELESGKRVTGVLETVGMDIVNLRVDRPAGAVVQLAIDAICACLL